MKKLQLNNGSEIHFRDAKNATKNAIRPCTRRWRKRDELEIENTYDLHFSGAFFDDEYMAFQRLLHLKMCMIFGIPESDIGDL